MTVMGVAKFKRFFRAAAEVNVDKDDLKRYSEFVNHKLYDLLLLAEATARANVRDVVQPWDLPIPRGLQERVHEFRMLDTDLELEPILEQVEQLPPLDLALSDETQDELPMVIGGLSAALAETFKLIDPALKEPHSVHWERSFRLLDLLL
jgi:hypothetical protein